LNVFGFPEKLETLVRNLVDNAIRYTQEGGVTISCDVKDDDVIVTVADTGMGISAEDMPFIFERFYRGVTVSQSTTPGTGLGLSIVKDIVLLHNGTIDVKSEVGKGTIFTVTLPQEI